MALSPIRFFALLLISMLAASAAFGKAAEALVINSSAKDEISLGYRNILLEYESLVIAPGDTISIPFNENSFMLTAVDINISLKHGKGPVFAVFPGDVVHVQYDKAANTYAFAGSYPAELNFYKKLSKSDLGLGPIYYEMLPAEMPSSLEGFLSYWQKIRLEGEALVEELRALEGVREETKEYLARELRLRVFSALNLPALYHHTKHAFKAFPEVYRDSVIANARILPSLQALPAASSGQHLSALRAFILYLAVARGSKPTFKVEYELAKGEYSGFQREWACYSILEHAHRTGEDIKPMLADYRSWVNPGSKFLRKLTGEVNPAPMVLDRQLTSGDVLLTVDKAPLKMSELLSKHLGKVIYIDFWASWCAPCIKEFPASEALRQQYPAQDLAIVYLSIDQDSAEWRQASSRFLKDAAEQYRFEDKQSSKFIKHFGVEGIPRYMIIDQKGVVRFADAPRPSEPRLKEVLNDLMKK